MYRTILRRLILKRCPRGSKELSGRDISCTIDDLEYGYAYYKLGDYYRAYIEFDKILPLAWEKGKYILYFICLYNIHTLRYLIRNQFIWEENPDVDIDTLVKNLTISTYKGLWINFPYH